MAVSGKRHDSVAALIDALVRKGVVEKKQRGLNKTNLYLVTDRASMWSAATYEEVARMAKETDEEGAVRYLSGQGYRITGRGEAEDAGKAARILPPEENRSKAKPRPKVSVPVAAPSAMQPAEAYSSEFLYEHTGMNKLIRLREMSPYSKPFSPYERELIDVCMNVIRETLNTTKRQISVNGEQKSAAVVKGIMMKVDALVFYIILEINLKNQ